MYIYMYISHESLRLTVADLVHPTITSYSGQKASTMNLDVWIPLKIKEFPAAEI